MSHAVGLRVKCGANDHEGYRQYSVGTKERTMKAMSSYIDDIYVNEEVISVDEVKAKLESFGLTCKDPGRLKHGAKVLGPKVWGERDTLRWKRGTAIPELLLR